MSTRVTVLSVHPDDETLGAAGTLLRHIAAGDEVTWIVATTAWEPKFSPAVIAKKAREVDQVAGAYGFMAVVRLDLPTTRLADLPMNDLLDALAPALDASNPSTLYTIHAGDAHSDHRVMFDAVSTVFKPFRAHRRLERFLSFETLSSTDAAAPGVRAHFVPNVYVDITPHIDRKIELMGMFESERQEALQPRSAEAIRALARFRGATVGCDYAEAFMLIREIRALR